MPDLWCLAKGEPSNCWTESAASLPLAMTTLISSCSWVPRGYAAQFPKKYAFDDKEYMRIAEMAKLQLNDAQADLDDAQNGDADEVKSDSIDASLKEYDLEHYDDEDHEPGESKLFNFKPVLNMQLLGCLAISKT